MADDSWRAHITYLENEVTKIGERADKLEAMAENLESGQKKHAMQELISRLRDAAKEHRKYLALVNPRSLPMN